MSSPNPAPLSPCGYDFYQLKMHVNLAEDDSCLFQRFGSSIFNVKLCDASPICTACGISGSSDGDLTKIGHPKLQDATIIRVDIDKCDCTKATFTVVVRLPCVRECKPDEEIITSYEAVWDTFIQNWELQRNFPPIPSFVLEAYDAFVTALDAEEQDCLAIVNSIEALLEELTNLKKYYESAASAIDEVITALESLLELYGERAVHVKPGTSHHSRKFCLVSGASGFERSLVTFLVKPLPANIVSTGVVTECYSYEITRIRPKILQLNDKNGYVCLNDNTKYIPAEEGEICDESTELSNSCIPTDLTYDPSRMQITVPFTEEIRCLVPDFNLPGTLINSNVGALGTIVKVVAQCPRPFAFPAMLTFDKTNCTACLNVDIIELRNLFEQRQEALNYGHAFGTLGCNNGNTTLRYSFLCAPDFQGADQFGQALFNSSSPSDVFAFFASIRRFDVIGVHKCTERSLFSFQICMVPQPEYCIDVCGCKIKVGTHNPITPRQFGIPGTLSASKATYKVQMKGDHTYMFDLSPTILASTTTTTTSTTSTTSTTLSTSTTTLTPSTIIF